MNQLLAGLLLSSVAYLIGATPFGYLTGRVVKRIDIRQYGSGNIGATNVGRVLGTRWGLVVFVLDFCKGLLPVAVLPKLLELLSDNGSSTGIHWSVAAGVATVLGHMFPIWLGFRGGKGVATALGVVAWLAPWATLAAASVFAVSFLAWRIISLASILGSLSFAVCQLALLRSALFSPQHLSLTVFSLLVPALILLRHRGNIARLMRGEEPRYRSGDGNSDLSKA
jgi:glycerol-3-phosphate acyltransferase PlsY